MSVAACEALALADALERESLGEGLARRFFRAASKVIDVPWSTAVRADLAIVGQPGTPGLAARLMNAYMQRLIRAAEHDAQVANAFRKVTHLVAPPASLLAPALVARVWWGSRGAPMKGSASVSAARTA